MSVLKVAVAELKCLSGLYLHYNNLSGEIPPHISNLTDLVDLYLDVNSLSGTIPPEVGNMASLQVLQLGDNQLFCHVPWRGPNTLFSFSCNLAFPLVIHLE